MKESARKSVFTDTAIFEKTFLDGEGEGDYGGEILRHQVMGM
jgi:hypothetical protein